MPRTQFDCEDHEDNLILDLTAYVDADVIVTADLDLLKLGPNRHGRLVISSARFVGRADGAAGAGAR